MAFAGDSLGVCPIEDLVGVLVVRLSALRFIARPVETEGAEIKERGKASAILLFRVRIGATRQEEQVAAKEEFVAQLLDCDLHLGQGFRLCTLDLNDGVSLAMAFDTGPGAV